MHSTSYSYDGLSREEKWWCIGCLIVALGALAYVFVCSVNQERLMNKKYGQKKDNPIVQKYQP